MNSSQPRADTEYSTSPRPSERPAGRSGERSRRTKRASGAPVASVPLAPRVLACAGAATLAVSEFCPLLHVRTIAAHPRLVHSVRGGSHHEWALLVIAVLAALLSLAAGRSRTRATMIMVAFLGAAALAVMVGVDLPDVHAVGLVATAGSGPAEAQAHAAVGLYLETLGALGLLLAGALAAVFGGRPSPSRETRGLPTARDRGLR